MTEFSYNSIDNFNYVIDYYIRTNKDINTTLYDFITNIIEDYRLNETNLNIKTLHFLEYLDSLEYDIWFVDTFMFNLLLNYYSLLDGIDNYNPNKSFREWCDKWYRLYKNHHITTRAINNIIKPFQNRFLENLFNPHTELGHNYIIKQASKIIPWDK